MRALFGISIRLRLRNLGFGYHVLDGKVILGGVGLGGWLNSFTLPLILWSRIPQKRVLDDGGLLGERKGKCSRGRESSWIFSNILWKIDVLRPPQLEVSRNSCLIKRL